jgi:glycosyltransferase involved in cell wall biosynthesis
MFSRRWNDKAEIVLLANISLVPEIRKAMVAGISPEGLWSSYNLRKDLISRDWLHWPCALEGHQLFSVRPYFIWPSVWRRFQKLGPECPAGIGQPIDWPIAFHVLRMAPKNGYVLAANNVSIATTLYLKKRGLLEVPLWCVLHGMAERLEQLNGETRAAAVELYNLASRQLVWGPTEAEYLRTIGLHRVEVITFGVDTEFWTPGDCPRGDHVLSVGWDNLRDYRTLSDASTYPLKIVSRPSVQRELNGVRADVIGQPSCVQLRGLYREARVVAIVTRDAMRPSGQISIMQAMACGRPVVMTRTRSKWSDKLVSGENCLLVPPGDVRVLRDSIRFLWEDAGEAERIGEAARATVLSHFPFEALRETLLPPSWSGS